MTEDQATIKTASETKEKDELSEKDLDRVAGGLTIVPGSAPVFEGQANPLNIPNTLTGNLETDWDNIHH